MEIREMKRVTFKTLSKAYRKALARIRRLEKRGAGTTILVELETARARTNRAEAKVRDLEALFSLGMKRWGKR